MTALNEQEPVAEGAGSTKSPASKPAPNAVEASRPARAGRVLMVDDEAQLLRALSRILRDLHYEVTTFESPTAVLASGPAGRFDVAVVDIRMPEMTGIELLEHLKALDPDLQAIIMTANGTVTDAFDAVRRGALSFLRKPFEKDELALAVAKAMDHRRLIDRNRYLEQKVGGMEGLGDIIGNSNSMKPVFELITLAAPSQSTILVLGETGVGKDLVAQAIHKRSARKGPCVAVNCSALSENLLEAELFGTVKGGFTGAEKRDGLFVAAEGGTLFLDEVGEMSPGMQAKLLRALENREVRPVGADKFVPVNVRVIAATHVDLDKAVAEGRFRADLLARLRVLPLRVPPLRERLEDVPLIAYDLLKKLVERENKPIRRIAPELMDAFVHYHWPENVRELRNVLEGAVAICQGDELTPADCRYTGFAEILRAGLPRVRTGAVRGASRDREIFSLPFKEAKDRAIDAFERDYVTHVLEIAGGNRTKAAQLAQMDRTNFRRVLKRSELDDTADLDSGSHGLG